MHVLLTGASGYLGLHVLESLVAAGHAVTVAEDGSPAVSSAGPQRFAGS